MPRPVRVPFSEATEEKLVKFLNTRIMSLNSSLRELHGARVTRWRRAYQAVPSESLREFPFYRASNLVVPLIAIHSDTLLARILSAIFKTRPLWVTKILGAHQGAGEELRSALEEFLDYVGVEPSELDLYRVYHESCGETIRYGTSVIKVPWETQLEDFVVPAGDGSGSFEYSRRSTYDGPRPEKIPFEDFLIAPTAKTLEMADLKIHRRRLKREELEERAFLQIYNPKKVAELLKSPDRMGPDPNTTQKERDIGVHTSSYIGGGEWDIYECWVKMNLNNKLVRMIISYHFRTKTILRAFFNFYPENDEPFIASRLFFRDDQFHGIGFCERLRMHQEELSVIHNQRRDNQTIANTRVWRVNPDSKLHEGYRIYPSAMLPAEKDEIEPLAHGDVGPIAMEEEQQSLELATMLSGVSPGQQGRGAGIMHGRKGVYTAQGTMSIMQDANTRTDMNVTDMRYAHTKLGRMVCRQYAQFGVGELRLAQFGERAELIKRALKGVQEGTVGLPVYAATASVNREVEKQNTIMLVGVMNRHYQSVAQLLSGMQGMMTPQVVKDYLGRVIEASDNLMKEVLREFGKGDVDRLVPKADVNAGATEAQGESPEVAGSARGGALQ